MKEKGGGEIGAKQNTRNRKSPVVELIFLNITNRQNTTGICKHLNLSMDILCIFYSLVVYEVFQTLR